MLKAIKEYRRAPNGEIVQDTVTGEYIVWDEVYSDEIGRALDLLDAIALYEEYLAYLNGRR